MVWTVIGELPPTGTSPTMIVFDFRRSMSRYGRMLIVGIQVLLIRSLDHETIIPFLVPEPPGATLRVFQGEKFRARVPSNRPWLAWTLVDPQPESLGLKIDIPGDLPGSTEFRYWFSINQDR